MRRSLLPLAVDIPTKATAYEHIEYVGAGSLGIGAQGFGDAIRNNNRAFFTRGISRDALPEDVQSFQEDERIFLPCLRNPENVQLRASTTDQVATLARDLGHPELETSLLTVFETGTLTPDEIRQDLIDAVPEVEELANAWAASGVAHLKLTSVGLAIGHGYWRRVTGITAPLSIWVSD